LSASIGLIIDGTHIFYKKTHFMASNSNASIGSSLKKFYEILLLDKQDISSIYAFTILAGIVQLSLPLGIQTIISFVTAGSVLPTLWF
jgi:hypothetical protein